MEEDRRLIEETLPIKEISREAAREKSIRHGHISTLHIWWARRPLVASRAAVFASLVKNPKKESERKALIKQLIAFSKWKNSNNRSLVNAARQRISKDFNHRKPKVLDCFAGGGSIPLEMLRLNCETHSLELNPVAYIVQLCTLVYPQKYNLSFKKDKTIAKKRNLVEDIEQWGNWVLKKTREKIEEHYPRDKDLAIPVAYLWARTVKCPNPTCGVDIPLLKQFWLSNTSNRKTALKVAKDESNKELIYSILHDEKIDFDPSKGIMKRGSARCPYCDQIASSTYIKEEGKNGRIGERLIAVVLSPTKGPKKYRSPNRTDLLAYEKSRQQLAKIQRIGDFPALPNEKIPDYDSRSIWVHLYGFETWSSLFNFRQRLALVTFCIKIREAYNEIVASCGDTDYAKAVVTYLAMALDRLVDYNSTLCIWANSGEFIAHTFGRQALPVVWDYAEVNPFSGFTGSWSSALNWITRVVSNLQKTDSDPAEVIQGSALRLPYNNQNFDAIITDPPYYDAISYSDLSDFFYVWLRRCLYDLYPDIFSTPLTPKGEEIVMNNSPISGDRRKDRSYFENNLTLALKEISRVLKDDGIVVLVFAHKSTAAWEALINSLLSSRLVITSSWPLHTERPGRLRAQGSAALASSIFITCRKGKEKEIGYLDEIRIELNQKVHQKLQEFWSQGIRGADFFISAIGPAVEVFGKYRRIRRLSGEEVEIGDLLDLVREVVTDYSLRKILHESTLGNIDEVTRFYVLWRWAYNDLEIVFDEARKLAQAVGAEADQLIARMDLLQKKGDKVKLLGPIQRAKNKDLGDQIGGVPAPLIDVIHKCCLLWEKGNMETLELFLSDSGYEHSEILWNVGQALSVILPEGNKEKQLLQGLLASKPSVLTIPKTKGQTTLVSFKEES